MQPKTKITQELYEYAVKYGVKEHPILTELRLYTEALNNSQMQIPIEEGQFIAQLARITNCQKYLEVGVFTGYSTLAMALSMSDEGKIYALDISPESMNIAKEYWAKAHVSSKITPIVGFAIASLEKLLEENHAGTFDIAFIDADKSNYISYYELCLQLVRPHGIILIDNVLMHGRILDANSKDYVKAIHECNLHVFNDERVDICLLPFADGLTIAYKKG